MEWLLLRQLAQTTYTPGILEGADRARGVGWPASGLDSRDILTVRSADLLDAFSFPKIQPFEQFWVVGLAALALIQIYLTTTFKGFLNSDPTCDKGR